jgi:type II secretory pathway component PulF
MKAQRTSDVLEVTRQLATLIRLGYPLVEGLKRCNGPRWMGELADDLQNGDDLVQAMSRRPRLFSPTYRTLLEAALASGDPVAGMEQLCHWLETSAQVRKRVRATLSYPFAILILALVLGAFFLLVLVPEMAIPIAETSRLYGLASLFKSRILLLGILVLGVGAYGLVLVPPVQRVVRLADQALWTRGLATLLMAGKPLPECLEMLGKGLMDRGLASYFQGLPARLRHGSELPELLQTEEQLHTLLRWCGTRAKKSDDLILALFQTADLLEEELDNLWRTELKTAEPRLMAGTGVVVVLVLLTAWLPIMWAGSGAWM